MIVRFLGTRGYVEESSPRHRMHSAVMLEHRGKRLLMDAGETWKGELDRLDPDWIVITHAHPDHAFGLELGAPCPVYVSSTSKKLLRRFERVDFRTFRIGRALRLGPFEVLPYRVVHSLRAPAVGFRVRADDIIAYNPDVVSIPNAGRVLRGITAYIGDGATLTRPLVRRRDGRLFGHTTVRAQLGWCARAGVRKAFIVHCGKQLIEMPPRALQREVDKLAAGRVDAVVTHDGLEVRL